MPGLIVIKRVLNPVALAAPRNVAHVMDFNDIERITWPGRNVKLGPGEEAVFSYDDFAANGVGWSPYLRGQTADAIERGLITATFRDTTDAGFATITSAVFSATFATPANTLARGSGTFVGESFVPGMQVQVIGSVSNDGGIFTVGAGGVAAGVLTLLATDVVVAEVATAGVVVVGIGPQFQLTPDQVRTLIADPPIPS